VAKPLRFLAFLICIVVLCALTLPVALRAQGVVNGTLPAGHKSAIAAADDDDADENADEGTGSALFITVRIDEVGQATVHSSVPPLRGKVSAVAMAKPALESALSCRLIDSHFSRASKTPEFYYGSCTPKYSGSRFSHEGVLVTAPLVEYCQRNNIEYLQVDFNLPQSANAQTTPAPEQHAALVNQAAYRQLLMARPSYYWTVNQNIPARIAFRFGYPLAQIQRSGVLLFALLVAPLVLLSWLGRKALSADAADKAMVWFSYMRALSWILNGSLLFWWAALDYFKVEAIFRFLAAGTFVAPFQAHPMATQILGWVPPSIVWLLCYRISQPIQEKLRGLQWTKRELTLQALYSLLAGLFPFAMFLTGLGLFSAPGHTAALWFVGAIFMRVFGGQALLKLTGMQRHALTTGDLRDRAFTMAEQVGVKLQQVYLIPSGKGQMANAFASSGNNISFTDFLLQRMNPREVDYVMAHELMHLRLKHPSKLGMARLGGFFVGLILMTGLYFVPAANFALSRYLFLFTFMTVVPFFISRRFEYTADAGAVATTGDPRAAISALFKLSALNMHPLQWGKWSEKWLSHPSSLRRAQALAKKAGIAFEEIPTIAREGAADASTYSPKSITAPSDKLHSTQFKKSSVLKLSLILLAILAFIPCFCALAARHIPMNHVVQFTLFALSIPATFSAVLLFSNYIPRLTRGNIAMRLDQKLSAQDVQVSAWDGIYVGLAPSAAPRSYEANSFWDIGYLFFRSDRICYWGEEMQFALRREQITDIKLGMGLPGYLGAKRVYIAWRDEEKGSCGVFNLGRGHSDSVRSGSRQTGELSDRLRSWWKTSSATRPIPAPLETLTSPQPRTVTCAVPGAMWKSGKLFGELLATAWIGALGAMLCGLPFHLMQYLTAPSLTRLGIPEEYHSPGAGWFVVLAASLVRLLSLIPVLRYQDKPILVVQPLAKKGSAATQSSDASRSHSSQREPVSVG